MQDETITLSDIAISKNVILEQAVSMVTDSTITPDCESSSPREENTTPEVPEEESDEEREKENTFPEENILKLNLVSPQMETVVMRRSPASPARNRCVRSDFFSNLVEQGLNTGQSLSGQSNKGELYSEQSHSELSSNGQSYSGDSNNAQSYSGYLQSGQSCNEVSHSLLQTFSQSQGKHVQ